MKNAIFLVIGLIVSLINLNAQDREPSPWNFVWGSDTINTRPFIPDSFAQRNVITGFQWGTTLNMNNALLNNGMGVHGYPRVTAGSRIYPMQITDQPVWHDSTAYEIGAWNAPFMLYEPTLPLDKNNLTNANINRPNNFLGADNSASKKLFAQLIKFA